MASRQQLHEEQLADLLKDAFVEFQAGSLAAAEEKYRRLVTLHQRARGLEHKTTLCSMSMLASCLLGLGRCSEAEVILRDVLQIKQQSPDYGMEHPSTLDSVRALGDCLIGQERWKDAERMLRSVHGIHARVHGPLDKSTLAIQVTLGLCLTQDNQLEEAERLLRDACQGFETQPEQSTDYLPRTLIELGRCLDKGGRYAEAEPLCRRAVGLARRSLGEYHRFTILAYKEHAIMLEELGRHAEAEVTYKLALQGSRVAYTWDDTLIEDVVAGLTMCMGNQGKLVQLETLVRDLLSRVRQDLGEDHPTTVKWKEGVAHILREVDGVRSRALRAASRTR